MILIVLAVLGLIFGSFSNAVIWRVHEQELEQARKKPKADYLKRLSIAKGRSMCSHCHHELSAFDLIPVISWLALRGKCRYCHQPIPDSPIVEIAMAAVFVVSYLVWPNALDSTVTWIQFGAWLATLVGLVMLAVYDLRWYILPNRMLIPTAVPATIFAICAVVLSSQPVVAIGLLTLAVALGGGVFFLLFHISKGSWIGGGDVKLGWVLGLVALTPAKSVLFIFIAALLGSLASLPLLASGKLKKGSVIPFGPFLIAGAIIVVWWGSQILDWYSQLTLGQ